MGSFLQLVAVYSDLPYEKYVWKSVQMMENCQSCYACSLKCPTGAIPSDRFLLYAERCIVFHNEKKGNIPFPTWIDRSWHNCLVGCLLCQTICPMNKEVVQWTEGRAEFSEEETNQLLHEATRSQLSSVTIEKLSKLDLLEYLDHLPRNLGVFFQK